MRLITNLVIGVSAAVMLVGCKAGGDNQGLEYAPNMYHSVAYEPLTQITDPKAGWYFNALDSGGRVGEFYNSLPFNPYNHQGGHINLRMPPKHTVRRSAMGWLPYRGTTARTKRRRVNCKK